jgi:hypothetical protein
MHDAKVLRKRGATLGALAHLSVACRMWCTASPRLHTGRFHGHGHYSDNICDRANTLQRGAHICARVYQMVNRVMPAEHPFRFQTYSDDKTVDKYTKVDASIYF